jgi:hypothetical protein
MDLSARIPANSRFVQIFMTGASTSPILTYMLVRASNIIDPNGHYTAGPYGGPPPGVSLMPNNIIVKLSPGRTFDYNFTNNMSSATMYLSGYIT